MWKCHEGVQKNPFKNPTWLLNVMSYTALGLRG